MSAAIVSLLFSLLLFYLRIPNNQGSRKAFADADDFLFPKILFLIISIGFNDISIKFFV